MATGTIYRKDMWFIQLIVPAIAFDSQSWDQASGGSINPTMVKYPPGGMGDEIPIGGRRTREDMTVIRAWDDTLINIFMSLDAASGNTPAQIAVRPLARRNVGAGKSIVYGGMLGQVTGIDTDSSSSDASLLTVVLSSAVIISGGGK